MIHKVHIHLIYLSVEGSRFAVRAVSASGLGQYLNYKSCRDKDGCLNNGIKLKQNLLVLHDSVPFATVYLLTLQSPYYRVDIFYTSDSSQSLL